MAANFNRQDYSASNKWCDNADIDQKGSVDLVDMSEIAGNWNRYDC